MEKYLTPQEVADKLNISVRELKYSKKVNIPYTRIGVKRRYKEKDVDKYMEQNKIYGNEIRHERIKYVV